jgi:FkbM family methyltransferase
MTQNSALQQFVTVLFSRLPWGPLDTQQGDMLARSLKPTNVEAAALTADKWERMLRSREGESSADDETPQLPGLRWDRKLRNAMVDNRTHVHVPTRGPDVSRLDSYRRRIKQYLKAKAVHYLKTPLGRLREFLNVPIYARMDAIGSDQQALAKSAESTAQSVAVLEVNIQNIARDLGYLHQKLDEAAVKSRPVVRRDGAYAVPLADGYLFIPEEEEALLLMYSGAGSAGLEPGTRRILQAVVGPGGHAVDVGASVGLHTLALARAVGQTGRVDAFEAAPGLQPYLQRTLAVNGFGQVHLHNMAVGAKDGTASFQVARTIGHSSLYELGDDEVRDQVTVQLRQLDSVSGVTAPIDLIKIDVEGAELDVIRGAKKILSGSPECVVVAEFGPSHLRRAGVSVEDWFSEFTGHGFGYYGIAEPSGNLHRVDLRWAASQHSVNILFVRPGARIEKKLLNQLTLLLEP